MDRNTRVLAVHMENDWTNVNKVDKKNEKN